MNADSRLNNSIRNAIFGMSTQIINIILGFINRSVFIHFLTIDYLGISGVFTNLLTMLSLAELGVASSMVYSLYKPLANKDKDVLQGLMKLYANIYRTIAIIILIIGIIIIPYLPLIVDKDINIDNLNLIYILYLLNTVLSYLFSYKKSLISADQKEYINLKYRNRFNILRSLLQMTFLYLTSNFIIYLLIQIVCTFMENLFISIKANKLYPFLKSKDKIELPYEIKKELSTNVKSTMIYKISGVMLDSTDNLIISSIVGLKWVGLLANYNLIISSVNMLMSVIFNSVTASVGNFIAKESKEKQEGLFYVLFMISFCMYGFSSICLITLTNPFIKIWLGNEFLFDIKTLIIIVINFYIIGMQSTVWMYRSTMGLYRYGKWRPIISAILNIFISVFLGNRIGLIGVLLGTSIVRVLTNVWYDPIVIFRYGFGKSSTKYYYVYLKYLLMLIGLTTIVYTLNIQIDKTFGFSFMTMTIFNILISIVMFIIILYRTKEFKYIFNMFILKINGENCKNEYNGKSLI